MDFSDLQSLAKKILIGACAVLVFIFILGKFFISDRDGPIDKPAPNFLVARYEGEPVGLADLRGKYVLVNFWATWCEPCRQEIPHLVEAAKELSERDVEVLAMNVDEGDQPRLVAPFIRDYPGLGAYLVYGTDEVAMDFNSFSLPKSYVIDPQGNLIFEYRGAMNKNEILNFVDRAVAHVEKKRS